MFQPEMLDDLQLRREESIVASDTPSRYGKHTSNKYRSTI
jgi:hypothetical protein